MLMAQAGGRFA